MANPDVPYSFLRNAQMLFQAAGPRIDVSTPEKRLALAVLADAVRVVRRGRSDAAEDEAWFASDATDHPFGFVSICQALGLDADHLRAGILRRPGDGRHAHAA